MKFEQPDILWLAVLPFSLLVFGYARRVTSTVALLPRVQRLVAGARQVSAAPIAQKSRTCWRLWLGLMCAVFALARPQWGEIQTVHYEPAREVLIALDLSRSMLADDVKPSRLDRARLLVESLLAKLRGERVGLMLFAGTAFLQSPMSADYEVLREFLPVLGPDMIPQGGTNYPRMLDAALEAFPKGVSSDRYLIILSDGESESSGWREFLPKLRERNVRVISLGIGTMSGAVIPGRQGGFVKDERGAVVLSKLEPATLQELANATGGKYADASTWVDLPAILESTVAKGKAARLATKRTERHIERFQIPLAAALLFLAWSYWREFPVALRQRNFQRKTAAAAALVFVAGLSLSPLEVSANPAPQAAPEKPSEIAKLVGELSVQPKLSAKDAARLAETTCREVAQNLQGKKPLVPSVVHDALAAVDHGEALDAKAADWADLRARLEKLLEPPPKQEPPLQEDKNDKKDEEKDSEKNQSSDQQPSQGEKNQQQDPSQKSEGEKGDASKDQQQSGQAEDKKSEPTANPQEQKQNDDANKQQSDADKNAKPGTQKIGGEEATEQEKAEANNERLTVPLEKLNQVRSKDSPAELFRKLDKQENRSSPPATRDW